MRKNIVLIGEIASGKTTIANKLKELYGYNVYSFATELKSIFQLIYKRPVDKSIDREKMQYLGQIIKKRFKEHTVEDKQQFLFYLQSQDFYDYFMKHCNDFFHESFFTNKLSLNYKFHIDQLNNNVTLDDMRFKVEQKDIFSYGKSFKNNVYFAYLDVDKTLRYERILKRDYKNSNKSLSDIEQEIMIYLEHSSEKEIQNLHYDRKYKIDFDTDLHQIAVQIYLDAMCFERNNYSKF